MDRENEKDVLKKTYLALKQTQKRLEDLEAAQKEPLAVIGMGCRFPGGANDPEAFWRLLEQGVDASSEIPSDRWELDRFHDSDTGAPGKTHASRANFLETSVDEFDAHFFNISGKECASLDP